MDLESLAKMGLEATFTGVSLCHDLESMRFQNEARRLGARPPPDHDRSSGTDSLLQELERKPSLRITSMSGWSKPHNYWPEFSPPANN